MNIVPDKSEFSPSNLLVILDDDTIQLEQDQTGSLISRTLILAKTLDCSVELFYLCLDEGLQLRLFGSDSSVKQHRKEIAEEYAGKLAHIAQKLKAAGVQVTHDTQWDHPEADGLLRKIEASLPDIVLKKAADSMSFLGLFNTDRDLIRQSPCHIWFVKDTEASTLSSMSEINRILTAVGSQNFEDNFISPVDYKVFKVARTLSAKFNAENVPVHAYQVPVNVHAYSNYAPYMTGIEDPIPTATSDEALKIAKQHGKAIAAFLEYFNIKPEMLQVCQGDLPLIIEELSESLHSELVIMAARNLSRWERLTESAMGMTSAGPVLSKAHCDVLYVKEKTD